MKLFSNYSIDECNNDEKLFKVLDKYKDDGKIEYGMVDKEIFFIRDLELEDNEINGLVKLFDDLEVYPYTDIDDDYYDEDDSYEDENYEDEY